MNIELRDITIREVVEGYVDNAEEGVVGYGGRLDIRPPYQREFIYKDKQRDEVVRTIRKKFPLNTMYWVMRPDGGFELMDGQQRTISFCQYVNGDFSVEFEGMPQSFHGLTASEQSQILDYGLSVYVCEGNDREKLDWFKIINIAGEPLTNQELRNAIYTGPWLAHAKAVFSKSNCAAYLLAKDLVGGSPIRQEILQTALNWVSGGQIEEYMNSHQQDPNANELWTYFQNVINWVELTFGCPKNYRREMKGVDWGALYDKYKNVMYDAAALESEVAALMADDDVTNKKGIYPYVFSRNQSMLSIRAFTGNQKREAYERQNGVCIKCGRQFNLDDMEGDHITPWSKGGKTVSDNCQMLCSDCNRRKSDV